MNTKLKQKFATQVDPDLIKAVRDIAREEGRLVQALVDEPKRRYDARRPAQPKAEGVVPKARKRDALAAGATRRRIGIIAETATGRRGRVIKLKRLRSRRGPALWIYPQLPNCRFAWFGAAISRRWARSAGRHGR